MSNELPGRLTDREFESYAVAQWRPLLRGAWLLTGNWVAAEDLVQSALAQVWAQWSRVSTADEPEAYVRRMLTNQFLMQQRRRSSTEQPRDVLPESSTPDATTDVDRRVALTRALDELSPQQRAAVVLRYFIDLSLEQTAAALDCSVGTAKSRDRAGPGVSVGAAPAALVADRRCGCGGRRPGRRPAHAHPARRLPTPPDNSPARGQHQRFANVVGAAVRRRSAGRQP
jgi:RNA polymerase sigma-70 factor (sigma-E family)